MINNRQAGRRRGRNNQRQQGGGNRGNGDSGNRIDNRARGNATQLLEKYRNLARDAQLAGDRVNAEYYFQFADHYFRVLADNRARQEEQQARYRRPDEGDGDGFDMGDDGDMGGDEGDDGYGSDGESQPQPHYQQQRRPAERRDPERRDDERRDDERRERRPRDRAPEGRRDDNRQAERAPRPRVANDDRNEEDGGEDMINLAVLPPAIGRVDDAGDEAPAPRGEAADAPPKPRRGRRPRQPEAAE